MRWHFKMAKQPNTGNYLPVELSMPDLFWETHRFNSWDWFFSNLNQELLSRGIPCGICSPTNARIIIRLNYPVGELEPCVYNLDKASDRDLHRILTDSNPLKKKQKVLGYIETIFDLSDVMLKLAAPSPSKKKISEILIVS